MAGIAERGTASIVEATLRADLMRSLEKFDQVFLSLLRRAASANSSRIVSEVSLAVTAKQKWHIIMG